MKVKTLLLSLTLITPGFLTSVAQNNFLLQDRLNRRNEIFDYPDYETPNFPMLKNAKSGQNWWEPDTVKFYNVNDNSPKSIIIFKYNSQGFLQERLNQSFVNNSWEIYLLYTYTYDSNNNMLSELRYWWENNSWVYLNQITRTYDSNNNLLSDWGTNGFISYYTYDSNNNMLTELRHLWQNNSLRPVTRFTYNYDSNNNLLTKLTQGMAGDKGINSSLLTYTYDSNNNVISCLHQEWNSNSNSWGNDFLSTYTYDSNNNLLSEIQPFFGDIFRYNYTYDSNNNMLTRLVQEQANNSWENSYIITYTYDSNNNLIKEIWQIWRNNSWANGQMYQMVYDENMNGTSSEYFLWSEESWQPNNNAGSIMDFYIYYNNMQSNFLGSGFKMTASYIKVSDIQTAIEPVAPPELNDISIYPNPTAGEFRVSGFEFRVGDIQVFDIYGIKRFSTFNFQLSTQIDISHLPAGIYFVRITTEKGVVTKKIVKK